MNLIIKAANFAYKAHEGQYRKNFDKRPYFYHVAYVAGKTAGWSDNENVIAAAFLHDSVEDCEVTFQQIKEKFGENVSLLVYFLTSYSKIVKSTEKRYKRKQMDLDHLAAAPLVAKRIKLEDRSANLEDTLAVANDPQFALLYCNETEDLLKVIAEAHPETADYIKSLILQIRNKYS